MKQLAWMVVSLWGSLFISLIGTIIYFDKRLERLRNDLRREYRG